MRLRASTASLAFVTLSAGVFGCQLFYEKNELTVATSGDTTTLTGGGGTGGTATTTASGGGGTATTMLTGGSGGTIGTTLTGSGGTTTTTTDCSDERLFVLATAGNGVLCATYAGAGGWTASSTATGSSNVRPAVEMLDAQTAVGVFFQGGAPGPLRAIELADGVCGAPADVPKATTKAAPSTTVLGGKVQALFQGAEGAGSDHPYVATWDPAAKWTPDPVQINPNVFSDAPAGLAANGAEMLAVYGGGDSNLYGVHHTGGAWQLPPVSFKNAAAQSEQANKLITPGVAALGPGKWLVVFQDATVPTQLRWLTAGALTSTPSQLLPSALSTQAVSLASLPGGAVLAFRGTNDGVYAAVYDALNDTWGAIQRVGDADLKKTSASPAVSAGICAHQAEVVYIDAIDSGVSHAFLEAGVWSVPAPLGGNAASGVAIARSP